MAEDIQNLLILQQLLIVQQQLQQQAYNEAAAVNIIRRRRRRRARQRRCWVRSFLGDVRSSQFGHFNRLMPELRHEDPASFHNFLRIPPDMFDELLTRLNPRITKQDTNYRKAIDPGLKLAATLRHLASGDTYASVKFDFRIPSNTLSLVVKEVCQAIVDEYKNEVIKFPTTPAEWAAVAEQFERRWNVPHGCGAFDGKHVAIRKPANSGSLYHNHQGFFLIVLMGLVDADYNFLWIDVGGDGYMTDAMIFNESELKECLADGSIGFPQPSPLPNDDRNMPYFILADDAFGLHTNLMKPYPQRNLTKEHRICNYRISRGRRIMENGFGILAQRWQVLLGTMQQEPDTARLIVEACVCLHNLMRMRYPTLQNAALDYEDGYHDMVPGAWRQHANMHDVDQAKGPNRDSTAAKKQRECLKLYFNSAAGSVHYKTEVTEVTEVTEDTVTWQDRMI
ncbi:PREDICTED: putative nuclease HARBI1 [Priapulus caudatus]|uniref:Nuclease HARBI1 n=1 Tax=Priapulus caudatus TaxID=37621 RepID=A0ABM1EHI9_PRICU|nr:PREDICTED: putative nuclease HARBI1 [Priapulus caudatus]